MGGQANLQTKLREKEALLSSGWGKQQNNGKRKEDW
jgi:hypothetical protein